MAPKPANWAFSHYTSAGASNIVLAISEDPEGVRRPGGAPSSLWLGTHGGGLDLHRGGGVFAHFRHDPAKPTSLSNDRVLALAEDADGRLWLATDGGGLNRLHLATGAFLRLAHDPALLGSLSSDDLNAVHVDVKGRLWVGTEGAGLDLLERPGEVAGGKLVEAGERFRGVGGPDEGSGSLTKP